MSEEKMPRALQRRLEVVTTVSEPRFVIPGEWTIGEAVEFVTRIEAAEREAAALAGPGADRPYSTREYLRANLFDGDESGVLTVTISTLLDDLVPVVNEYAALSRSETT